MTADIEMMVNEFEAGRMSRRQLVGQLTALLTMAANAAGTTHAQPTDSAPTLEAIALHHIALGVTDLDRSQKFYEQHLGQKVLAVPGAPPFMRFLTCQSLQGCWPKTHLLNLWKADKPELHHFCFTVSKYDQKTAFEKLHAQNLSPEQRGNSAYFRDPDGYVIQVGDRDAE
jgi:catechol 2,3-dioxygenase-like lactoylglutathione lyase family enzyme